MTGRRCHCGCRARLEHVRSHARYASKTCRRRAHEQRHPKASVLLTHSQTTPVGCKLLPTPPVIYASTHTRNSLTSLSGRKNPKQTPQFPQSGSRVAFSLSRTNVDLPENRGTNDDGLIVDQHGKLIPDPGDREPESFERQFVRWVYAEDCKLPFGPLDGPKQERYVPARLEPKLPPRGSMPPVNLVLSRLQAAGCEYRPGRSADEWVAHCPTHEDSQPSLVVRRNPNGSVWIKDWAGCSKEGILAALDLQWRDLWDSSERDHGRADGPPVKRLLTPELRRAMERMLAEDDERRAS